MVLFGPFAYLARWIWRCLLREALRHSFASSQLSAGAPPIYVMSCCGWSSPTLMFRVYGRYLSPTGGEMFDPQPGATGAQPRPRERRARGERGA